MGMVMGLEALTDADIEQLLADPPLVWLIVAELTYCSRVLDLRG
jgi:hypothetical protein